MWYSAPLAWKPDNVGEIALAVIRWDKAPPRWQHAGILYRDVASRLQLLHLEGHRALKRVAVREWVNEYAIVEPGIESPLQALWLAAQFDAIYEANGQDRIPYAFEYAGGTLDPATYDYVPHETAPYGLSCSTFILCAHHTAGVELVDTSTWQGGRDGDDVELNAIIEVIKTSDSVSPEHIAILRSEIGAKIARYRPHEVVASYVC